MKCSSSPPNHIPYLSFWKKTHHIVSSLLSALTHCKSCLTFIADVQQGEAQAKRGSRKGKQLVVTSVCVHCMCVCVQTDAACAILLRLLSTKNINLHMLNSPCIDLPIWVLFRSEMRWLFLWPKIPYLYILHELCENSLHFGQDHGGLRFCSNGNCSAWLGARYVILSPTLCSQWWMWETQGCEEWSEGALLRSLMRPLIRLMRLLWMRWAFHSFPFVLWLLYTTISHLSETKEVQCL